MLKNSIANTGEKKPGQDIEEWVIDWLAKNLNVQSRDISLNSAFADFGVDSIKAVELAQDIEDTFQIEVDPVVAWEAPTVSHLIAHITAFVTSVAPEESKSEPNVSKKYEFLDMSDEEFIAMLTK